MKIILDAMGGDNAPKELLLGAAAAVKELGVEIIAVGDEEKIGACAREKGITVKHAAETIEMCDDPTSAVRHKKDSSMVVALRLLAAGEGDALVSAGSTGALLTGATLGGNCTPIGASANIAGIGILRKNGYEVKTRDFVRIGIPFTLAAVIPAYIYLWLLFGA